MAAQAASARTGEGSVAMAEYYFDSSRAKIMVSTSSRGLRREKETSSSSNFSAES
jgi:hypothetical protein